VLVDRRGMLRLERIHPVWRNWIFHVPGGYRAPRRWLGEASAATELFELMGAIIDPGKDDR